MTNLELSLAEYYDMIQEARDQPAWRRSADIEDDYYEGNQLDSQTLALMAENGYAPIVENLIAPAIDSVLGLETKTRLDFRVTSSSTEEYGDVAEAINVKLNEAEREGRADRANSDAFAGQVKTGIGWVEVSRETDPFKFPIRFTNVHRNEMFWDMKSADQIAQDAKWIIRKKWYDVNDVIPFFKDKEHLIRNAANGWTDFDLDDVEGSQDTGLARDFLNERAYPLNEHEWRDTVRRRVCLHEVWYQRMVEGLVITTPEGDTVEFNENNKEHLEAVALGVIEPRRAYYSKIRVSFWIGSHKLHDMENPYPHNTFPYVPFFGKRESLTGVPYGLIRPMIPMQDQINQAETKRTWLLAAKRIIQTEGATVDDPNKVRAEAGRADAHIVLDAEAMRNGGMFRVDQDFNLSQQQYQSLVDKRQTLKDTAGIYSAFEGRNTKQSGVAQAQATEQSSQTLAEIYDNYNYARNHVMNLALSLVIEDIGNKEEEVLIEQKFQAPKRVVLNMKQNNDGHSNMIANAKLKVALSETPSTPGYKQQQANLMTEFARGLPQQYQAVMAKYLAELHDVPKAEQLIKEFNALEGKQTEPKTEEEMAQAQKAAAMQERKQKMLDFMDELAVQLKQEEVAKAKAETEKVKAETAVKRQDAQENEEDAELSAMKEQIERLSWMMQEMQKDRQTA